MRPTRDRLAFGPFELDPAERQLFRGGRPVALAPRSFDLLAVLVARAGHLVTKGELLERAWPDVVVEEPALSVAVSRLRAALGEEGRGCIEVVPGHGYRFVAPVEALDRDVLDSAYVGGDAAPRAEDVVPVLSLGDGAALVGPPSDLWTTAARPATRPVWWLGWRGLFLSVAVVSGVVLAVLGARRTDAPVRADAREPPAEALIAYRRGRALWASRRGAAMNEALGQFKRATALDSTFAQAYVGEAQVYALAYRSSAAAEAAIQQALALDPALAEAWATRGFVRAFQAWDWPAAEADFARARVLDPTDVTTLQWTASLRMVQRRLPEAEALLRRALVLMPDDAALHADLCEVRYYRRDEAGARAACDRALALDPQQPMALGHRFAFALAAPAGRGEAARRLADAGRDDFDNAFRARLHARLGARDSALVYVERAVAERAFVAPFFNPDPIFDTVREDPRWHAAMSRMGLRRSHALG